MGLDWKNGIFSGTETITVKLYKWIERDFYTPLATVESEQTKEIFDIDTGHLTTIKRCKEILKYKNMLDVPLTDREKIIQEYLKYCPYFYSNCFFEAIKHKFKNIEGIEIHQRGSWLEIFKFKFPHFYWTDLKTNTSYHFATKNTGKKCFEQIWFKGKIKRFPIYRN